MAYLRFTRDRGGYENTYLVETIRRRGREHTRVLYWFRSPPQVKVGRAAIDENAIQALEDAHPDITFDWARILEARPPEPEPASDERRRPRGRVREREPRREIHEVREPAAETQAGADAPTAASHAAETLAQQLEQPLPDETTVQGAVPATWPETADDIPALREPPHATDLSAAARLLGSEGLLRLRARFAEVGARIATQVTDPARREALRLLAERLNPDAWVTDADVQEGLEGFEQVLDEIRREVGPLRRRTRRGGRRNRRRRDGASADAPSSDSSGSGADESDGARSDGPAAASDGNAFDDDEDDEAGQ